MDNTSFDKCIKCSVCNLYCPIHQATREYPGPKHSGPDAERIRIKHTVPPDRSLALCSNCKRCEIACPSGVAITDMITRAKFQGGHHKNIIRDYILSHTDFLGKISTRIAPVVNFSLRQKPLKHLLGFTLGISPRATFPKYESSALGPKTKANPDNRDSVVLYLGCFGKYNYHKTAEAAIGIIEKMGYHIEYMEEKCCGVPLIANNFPAGARTNARHNINELGKSGKPVIVISPSCYLAMKHEYNSALGLDNRGLAEKLIFITDFLNRNFDRIKPRLKPVTRSVAYHTPCHLDKIGHTEDSIRLLKNIPGMKLTVMNSGCCGISGTYGFKKENYNVSQKVGTGLFRSLATANPDLASTDCETCKMQIEMNSDLTSLHPVELLFEAISG